jgi:hypothetical protein
MWVAPRHRRRNRTSTVAARLGGRRLQRQTFAGTSHDGSVRDNFTEKRAGQPAGARSAHHRRGQLAAQQISFPPASAFAHAKAGTEVTPSMIPSVSLGGGTTYSRLSTESIAQPGNTQLAATVNTVFKGETLRSMLSRPHFASLPRAMS